jgi:hypothetical protein
LGNISGAQVLVLYGSNDTTEEQLQQQQQVDGIVQLSRRPATPDTTDELPKGGPIISEHSGGRHFPHQPQQAGAIPSKQTSTDTASCRSSSSSVMLTWQQLQGLQLLAAAGTCHKEVAAALVEGGGKGPADFLWGRHLRHYYEEATGQLQVNRLCCYCCC